MKLPHHMSCSQPHPRLYQLADGRFQIVEEGTLAPLMVGHGYVLVEEDLAQYLFDLHLPGLEIVDAIIYDPWLKQEIATYRQLRIDQHFSWSMIRDIDPRSSADTVGEIDLGDERFLLMDQEYVFVTALLRERLEASRFDYLHFSEGLDGFAAGF